MTKLVEAYEGVKKWRAPRAPPPPPPPPVGK